MCFSHALWYPSFIPLRNFQITLFSDVCNILFSLKTIRLHTKPISVLFFVRLCLKVDGETAIKPNAKGMHLPVRQVAMQRKEPHLPNSHRCMCLLFLFTASNVSSSQSVELTFRSSRYVSMTPWIPRQFMASPKDSCTVSFFALTWIFTSDCRNGHRHTCILEGRCWRISMAFEYPLSRGGMQEETL